MSSRRAIGSKVEVEPGKWRLYVSAGPDPVTGKRARPSKIFYGSDRESDLELARMVASTGRRGTNAVSLWEFIHGMYLPALEPPELRRRTVDEYRAKLERYVKPSPIASMKLDRLDGYALTSWMRGVKQQVLNKQSQLHIYRALSAALGKAVEWNLVQENVLTRAVKAPVPDEHTPYVLTEDELNAYLDAFDGHVVEPVVVLATAGGLRPSEIYGLDWSDIDFDARMVTVDKTLHERSTQVWYEDTKSRTSRRRVRLSQWAIEALRPHRGIGPVIGALKPTQVAYRYRKHVQASDGLPWCTIENLRHTHATIITERGTPIEDVAGRLGHSTPRMSRERYVKRRETRDDRASAVMEEVRRKQAK